MEDTEHVHITFVPHGLLRNYQKDWPNHVFVEVPEALDDASDSVIKNLIKVKFTLLFFIRARIASVFYVLFHMWHFIFYLLF